MWPFSKRKEEKESWKGLTAGLIGGAAGTLASYAVETAVNYAEARWYESHRPDDSPIGEMPTHARVPIFAGIGARHRNGGEQLLDAAETHWEPAAQRVATAVSRKIFRRELTPKQEVIAAPAVQMATGLTLGAAYGLAVEHFPHVAAGQGAAFGAGLMVAADEVAMPVMGLAQRPTRQPVSFHLRSLTAHIVFALSCECVRRNVRQMLH